MIGIFGFGVVGKNFAELLKVFDLQYIVFDDKLKTIDYDQLHMCDIAVVCTGKKDLELLFLDRLKKAGFDRESIKFCRQEIYPKAIDTEFFQLTMAEIIKGKKTSFAKIIKSDKPNLDRTTKLIEGTRLEVDNRIQSIKFELARARYTSNAPTENNIFYELYKNKKENLFGNNIFYPYFVNWPTYETEFGFREDIDWSGKSYVGKEIVCIFGNSQAVGVTVDSDQTVAKYLEEYLNLAFSSTEFVVLNIAAPGCTTPKEMIFFLLLIEKLAPKIVISMFGIDLFAAFMDCDKMIKRHYLPSDLAMDKVIKELYGSDTPLLGEGRMINRKVDISDSVASMVFRYKQFKRVVEGADIVFIGCIQPFLKMKKKWHRLERKNFKQHYRSAMSDEYGRIIEYIPELIKEFKKGVDAESLIDLNNLVSDSEDCLFDDYIHTSAEGNRLIASFISSYVFGLYGTNILKV